MPEIFKNKSGRGKLEEIYGRYRRDMYVTAYSILRDSQAAEDAVQNAMINIQRHIDKISDVECKKTRAYIVIIVRNLCLDSLKGHAVPDSLDAMTEEPASAAGSPDELLLAAERRREMAERLLRLHRPYADILVLRYYNELTISEISDLLGISENNVSVRINRALSALRKMLEKEGGKVE